MNTGAREGSSSAGLEAGYQGKVEGLLIYDYSSTRGPVVREAGTSEFRTIDEHKIWKSKQRAQTTPVTPNHRNGKSHSHHTLADRWQDHALTDTAQRSSKYTNKYPSNHYQYPSTRRPMPMTYTPTGRPTSAKWRGSTKEIQIQPSQSEQMKMERVRQALLPESPQPLPKPPLVGTSLLIRLPDTRLTFPAVIVSLPSSSESSTFTIKYTPAVATDLIAPSFQLERSEVLSAMQPLEDKINMASRGIQMKVNTADDATVLNWICSRDDEDSDDDLPALEAGPGCSSDDDIPELVADSGDHCGSNSDFLSW
jgi:hypothetical protein